MFEKNKFRSLNLNQQSNYTQLAQKASLQKVRLSWASNHRHHSWPPTPGSSNSFESLHSTFTTTIASGAPPSLLYLPLPFYIFFSLPTPTPFLISSKMTKSQQHHLLHRSPYPPPRSISSTSVHGTRKALHAIVVWFNTKGNILVFVAVGPWSW